MSGDLSEHEFGGVSTDLKLDIVGRYLRAFTTALRNRYPNLIYLDAFAGTGERTVRHDASPGNLIDEPVEARVERLRGSARIAIETTPGFDRIVFMDTNRRHCRALQELADASPERQIEVVRANANLAIIDALRGQNWKSTRGVMFLDPYGMHVDWTTLETIRATEAIDVWYLVSLAGLYRQAAVDPRKVTPSKRNALTRMLGTADWEADWYGTSKNHDLFGELDFEGSRVADVAAIEAYVHKRLETLFPKVLPPLRLKNKGGAPSFSLFFAISNPDPVAMGLATRIAGHILRSGISSQRRSR